MKYLLSILLFAASLSLTAQLRDPFIYYKFDAVLTADSSGNNYHGKLYGGIGADPIQAKNGGYSAYLDGSGDYMRIPIADYGTEGVISFWARSDLNITDNRSLFFIADAADFFSFRGIATNTLRFYTNAQHATPALTWSSTTWHHLVFYFNKTSGIVRTWNDGVKCIMNDSTILTSFNSNDSAFIGVDYYRNAGWRGNIDEFIVYKGFAPTESQIDSLYNLTYLEAAPSGGETYTPTQYSPSYASLGRLKPSYNGLFKYMHYGLNPVISPPTYGINAVLGTEDYDGVCPSGATTLTDADCATKRFATAPLRKIADTTGYAKVYIDPTTDASGTGTLSDPYDSWADVSSNLTSYTAYLFKRGTTYTNTAKLVIENKDNIYVGAYGTGEKPKIVTGSNIGGFDILYSTNITIRDLYVSNPYYSTNTNTAFQIDASVVDIYNCEIQFQHMAVRSSLGSSYRVIECEIHDIWVDPFMLYSGNYIEIAWNDVYDFNLAYFVNPDYDYSPGDFIQVSGNIAQLFVHHDSIDRSDTGNKSIFQLGDYTVNMTVEYCKLGSPNWNGIDGQRPQILNAGLADGSIVFRNNHIRGNMPTNTGKITGLYGVGINDTIVGNVFEGFLQGIWSLSEGGSVVSNNTFYDNSTAIYHSSGAVLSDARNNIFWNNGTNFSNVTATINTNNITANPLFMDAVNHDFRLYSSSPAVNTGAALTYHTYDINGTSIPKAGSYDVGAYELDFVPDIDLEERPIFFAENMSDFATGAMPSDTLYKYWQPYWANYAAANQSIIDVGGEHGKVFKTQYLTGECGSGPGFTLAPMLDTTLNEIYIEVTTWFDSGFWDDPADGRSSGKTTFGGAIGGWWAKSTSTGLDFAVDTSNSHRTNGWGAHSVWGTPDGATSAYPNRVMGYYHDQLSHENTMTMPGCYVNRGVWATYTTRIKLNTYGHKNGIIERYKNGVLVSQQTDVYFKSMAQFDGGYNNIEALLLRFAVGGTNDYCTDRLLVEYFDDVIAYNYNSTSQYYIPGAAPAGHTIPILRGTVANHYPDDLVYNRTYTAQSDTISGNVTGATYAPVEQSATIEITGHTGNISMSFLGWFDGYNATVGSGYEQMWVKIWAGTGVGKTLLYTFDEAAVNGAPTLNATLPIGATSATIEYYTGRDLSIDWLLRYW